MPQRLQRPVRDDEQSHQRERLHRDETGKEAREPPQPVRGRQPQGRAGVPRHIPGERKQASQQYGLGGGGFHVVSTSLGYRYASMCRTSTDVNSSRAGSHSMTEAPLFRSSRATCRVSHRARPNPCESAWASCGSTCTIRTRLVRSECDLSEISRAMAVLNRSNSAVLSPGTRVVHVEARDDEDVRPDAVQEALAPFHRLQQVLFRRSRLQAGQHPP